MFCLSLTLLLIIESVYNVSLYSFSRFLITSASFIPLAVPSGCVVTLHDFLFLKRTSQLPYLSSALYVFEAVMLLNFSFLSAGIAPASLFVYSLTLVNFLPFCYSLTSVNFLFFIPPKSLWLTLLSHSAFPLFSFLRFGSAKVALFYTFTNKTIKFI
jgi:hypothetical protein